MDIKQFYDKNLAHASYAVISNKQIALIDPARDPMPYYNFARENDAKITTVIETHPHADFVSSHAEIARTTGAKIHVCSLINPAYEYTPFDDGDEIKLGDITLHAIHTPGHSPDSISILIKDEKGVEHAIATGDTLFVGDVGRPDLRESAGAVNKTKTELAKMMYNTIKEKLIKLPDHTIVYPAHGPGSLCGKTTSEDKFTTIGREKKENYAFQPMSEEKFVETLLADQSFVPKYFPYDVELNRKGAPDYEQSVRNVPRLSSNEKLEDDVLIIDSRPREEFMKGHTPGALAIREDVKFETWVGAIVSPDEEFYLITENEEASERLIRRLAKIGYESKIKGVLANPPKGLEILPALDIEHFKAHKDEYIILDVRNTPEVKKGKIFKDAVAIPLPELRERVDEVPLDKPIVIHCAGGYRSTIAASIIRAKVNAPVFDLGPAINDFKKK